MSGRGTAEALRAAIDFAQSLGVPVRDPVVIRDVTNVLVHLSPAPVVARISMTLSERGVASIAREIAVARHAADAGAPVVAPTMDPPAGPHVHAGFQISFWQLEDHDPARAIDQATCGRALRALHEALETYDGDLPAYDRLDEVGALLARLEPSPGVTAEHLRLLRAGCEEVSELVSALEPPVRAIHGDAHLGNVLRTSRGPIWTDLENVCAGPIELDLACLEWQSRALGADYDAPDVIAAYGPFDPELLEQIILVRALQATVWTIGIARRLPGGTAASAILAARLRWWEER